MMLNLDGKICSWAVAGGPTNGAGANARLRVTRGHGLPVDTCAVGPIDLMQNIEWNRS